MKWQLMIATILLSASLYGQNICGQNRYLEEVFSDIELTTGIEFANADPYGIINSQTLRLDIYEPDGDTLEERPIIIHAFGGAFLVGTRNIPDIPNWGTQYAKRGFVFISIDYRLGYNPLDQASVVRAAYRSSQDFRSALRFLSDSARVYGLDMDNVFLTGSSAGCFAALIQTFMNNADRPASTYGTFLEPQDLGCPNCTGNSNNNNQEVPVHGIVNNWGAILDTSFINPDIDSNDNVPVISFHGTNDLIVPYSSGNPFNLPVFPSVDGSQIIHEQLNRKGIYNRLYTLNGLGHEPELINPWVTDTIVENASSFLYEIMRPELDSIYGLPTACVGRVLEYSVPYNAESQYCWEVTGGNIVNDQQNRIEVEWQTPGLGNVSLTEYNEIHAKTSLDLSVEVGVEPLFGFQYQSNDGLFEFTSNDSSSNNYLWTFGDGDSSLLENSIHQYADTGDFVVQHTATNYYCTSKTVDTITSDICPLADFDAEPFDSTAFIDNNSLFASEAFWNLGNGNVFNGFNPSPLYSSNGTYSIELIVSNDFCSDTLQQMIEIIHCPIADFSIDKNGLEIDITNNSTNNFFNYWNFGNGERSRVENPGIEFDSTGIYEIELMVFNERACSDTLRKLVYVEPASATNSNDTVLEPVSVENIESTEVTVYPIPTTAFLNIELNKKANDLGIIRIWNLLGKEVYQSDNIPDRVDLRNLNAGVYILQIEIDGKLYSQKIIKANR